MKTNKLTFLFFFLVTMRSLLSNWLLWYLNWSFSQARFWGLFSSRTAIPFLESISQSITAASPAWSGWMSFWGMICRAQTVQAFPALLYLHFSVYYICPQKVFMSVKGLLWVSWERKLALMQMTAAAAPFTLLTDMEIVRCVRKHRWTPGSSRTGYKYFRRQHLPRFILPKVICECDWLVLKVLVVDTAVTVPRRRSCWNSVCRRVALITDLNATQTQTNIFII